MGGVTRTCTPSGPSARIEESLRIGRETTVEAPGGPRESRPFREASAPPSQDGCLKVRRERPSDRGDMMSAQGQRVLVVDPAVQSSAALSGRLRMQGYTVLEASDAAEGARLALSDPPHAVVADLWMPRISGVQICRLLRAEPGTRHVPVILRGPEGQRNRFWAEHSDASAYVIKGRMGDLVRALRDAIAATEPRSARPIPLAAEIDVRDRIASHLDAALFDSVLANRVRALSTCGEFERLFDLFSQFLSQVTRYRWVAISTTAPLRYALHANPATRDVAEREARAAFGFDGAIRLVHVEDEDAVPDLSGPPPIVRPITLAEQTIGHIALAVREPEHPLDATFVETIAREIAAPIRMASLVEESQRLATMDPLTGLMNRRAFGEALQREVLRAGRHGHCLAVVLLDVDHFKHVNDQHGHAAGDLVLAATGALLTREARKCDLVGRWGGEEFVVALHWTASEGAMTAAERIRTAIAEMVITAAEDARIPVTASLGVAMHERGDTLESIVDRADRAMYASKSAGRNRTTLAPSADATSAAHALPESGDWTAAAE